MAYSLEAGAPPRAATIDPDTGLLNWPTASNQPETSYSFTVVVADDSSPPLTAMRTFTVQVNPVRPPTVAAIPGQSVNIGQTLTWNLATYAHRSQYPGLAVDL